MIFDSHCHLNDPELYKDLEKVIENAHKANVLKMLVIGYDYNSSLLAVEIANNHEGCYAAIGLHPEEINEVSAEKLGELLELSKNEKVVAIGEIGLDYHWEKDIEKREKQKQIFIKQIEYANEINLPISVHCRDAIGDCVEILKIHTPKCGGVMHCYSGSVETAQTLTQLGMYIALGGTVTFKNAKTPKEVALALPVDKLLVETDAPYLAPHPYRGQRNEPAYIKLVIEEIANLKKVSTSEIEITTYENACLLFHV